MSHKHLFLLGLLLGLALLGCKDKPLPSAIYLEISGTEDSLLLLTYSSQSVQLRKIAAQQRDTLPHLYGKDTVYFHLLCQPNGALILPIITSKRAEIIKLDLAKQELKIDKDAANAELAIWTAKLGMPLQAKAVSSEDILQLCKERGVTATAWLYTSLSFRYGYWKDSLALDAIDSIMKAKLLDYSHYHQALFPGENASFKYYPYSSHSWDDTLFKDPLRLGSSKKHPKLRDKWTAKRPYAVVASYNGLELDSLSMAAEKQWMALADSLKIPVAVFFLYRDTVPTDPLKRRKHPKQYLALSDSLHQAALLYERYHLEQLPAYFSIDSLYHMQKRENAHAVYLWLESLK